jgi:hypothetical protein
MFDARIDRRNSALVTSRQPFVDCARALAELGCHPNATLIMRHAGAAHDALRAKLATAAGLTVADNRLGVPTFRRWMAPQSDVAAPPIAQTELTATRVANGMGADAAVRILEKGAS